MLVLDHSTYVLSRACLNVSTNLRPASLVLSGVSTALPLCPYQIQNHVSHLAAGYFAIAEEFRIGE